MRLKKKRLTIPGKKTKYRSVHQWMRWEAAWWIWSMADEYKAGLTENFTRCLAEEIHTRSTKIKLAQSGNYCYSSIRVASIDDVKKGNEDYNDISIYQSIYLSIYLKQTIKRSRRYPTKTITDADYADDIAILANTHNQAETQLNSLEWTAAGTDLHINAYKTEYMCFN